MTSTPPASPTPVPAPLQQAALAHHLKVGDAVVTTLLDASMQGSLAVISNVAEHKAQQLHEASLRTTPPRISLSAYLVNLNDRLILIDTGIGIHAGESGTYLLKALNSVGVMPAAIDTVLLTHLHVDHVGGLIDAEDNAAFPNATLMIPRQELDYWTGPEADALPESRQKHVAASKRALAEYQSCIQPIEAGEVLPGITLVPLPGHTPGHAGYMIESRGEQLLVWGDIVHLPQVQFPAPEAGVIFDVEPQTAQQTRQQLFEHAAREQLLIAGMHLDFPGIGHVVRDSEGYRFLPHVWQPTV